MKIRLMTCAAILVVTSGCAALGLNGPKSAAVRGSVDMAPYFAQRLESGREYLRAQQPAKAIEAFRQASYDPQFAAEAYNGMGVAYAMLGRADTARDLFARAIERNPTDQRFARNLERVNTMPSHLGGPQPMLAERALPPENVAFPAHPTDKLAHGAAPAVVPVQLDANGELPALPKQPEAAQPMPPVRSSEGLKPAVGREVFIKTAGHEAAAPSTVPHASPIKVAAPKRIARRPVVHLAAPPDRTGKVAVTQTAQTYPVRVTVTKPRQLRRSAARRGTVPGYPVRVAFGGVSHPNGSE